MEPLDIARIFFALLAVIGLIGLAALFARKMGLSSGGLNLGRDRRLALLETLPLDNRRRAAIIRCDGREHLVVLNPNNVTVIERGLPPVTEANADAPPAEPSATADARPEASRATGFAAALQKLRAFAPTTQGFRKEAPGDNAEDGAAPKATAG